MDPQSFIIGLMAGITLFGGAVLIAMILLERPRARPRRSSTFWAIAAGRLRDWCELKWSRRHITKEWLQAEEDHARLRDTALQDLQRKRSAAQSAGPPPDRTEKKEPPQRKT